MDEHVVHSVGNRTAGRSVALRLYLGDLFELSRKIWDLRTGTCAAYPDEHYFALSHTTEPV